MYWYRRFRKFQCFIIICLRVMRCKLGCVKVDSPRYLYSWQYWAIPLQAPCENVFSSIIIMMYLMHLCREFQSSGCQLLSHLLGCVQPGYSHSVNFPDSTERSHIQQKSVLLSILFIYLWNILVHNVTGVIGSGSSACLFSLKIFWKVFRNKCSFLFTDLLAWPSDVFFKWYVNYNCLTKI